MELHCTSNLIMFLLNKVFYLSFQGGIFSLSILHTYFYYITLIHLILKGHAAAAAAAAKSLQSCMTLCDPIDGSLPGSSVPEILQARILEQVAISFSNACMHAESLQLCLTLCDPMDSSPSGSSVHRISRQEY